MHSFLRHGVVFLLIELNEDRLQPLAYYKRRKDSPGAVEKSETVL